ncbi:autotransporter outer membrane beta-barrel domain-containing protein [Mediterranea massiliensis]|uniref:hypothetical protein n=1 Tax=Mediterranea massiliensis TaxID=1841865 RepID=UPI001114D247|nr:hypothetical protein [Mediterranea massiliensis]
MKTKNLLTAMVLPALFAACTQDEFESMSQQTPMLNGRQLVENVTLNVEGAAETRLAYGTDGYSWGEGDQIGACLMDEITSYYRGENTVWHQWFTLTDYIQTNYKFTRDAEGVWSTEAKLCEGNYFFAYPYNANMGLRDAYTFTAGEQVLEGTDKESLMKAYTENNSFVGYGKVEAGDKEGEAVAVTMIPVFGSTGITITNTGTNTYTIERVVLRGARVFDKATVNPTTCTSTIQYNGVSPTNDEHFNVAQYVQDPAEDTRVNAGGYYVASWGTYDKEAALRDVLDYDQAETSNGKVEVTINGNGTIQPQGSINVLAMVAPQTGIVETTLSDGNKDQIVLDIYTDKGIISDIQLNHWYTANDANTSTTTNVLTNDNLTSIGTGNKVEVTFDDTSLDKPATMDVYNEADLANLIHWNADQAKAITAILKADVNITKEMYDELAGSAITEAKIEGSTYSVTIEGDVADGALDAFKFNTVKEVLVNGTQSMKKSCASPIKVMSDATLNIAGNLKLAKDIENYGTLNVNAKVSVSNGLYLYIKNYSQMNVAAGKEIVENVKVMNGDSNIAFGTITNAGMIRRLVNPVGNAACGYVINTGIIGTEASVGDLATNENSVNHGRIDNNESGRVFLNTNTGDVYANATSTTRINNNSTGNIIITELDFNDGNFLTASEDKMGNIVQEIAENASTSTVDVRANTLWLSATLTVDETNADGEYTSVDLTGSRMRNGAVTVVATGANARISGNYSTATDQRFKIDAIKVAANATLVLNNVFATIKAANNVTMSGAVNRPATLTINSNAVLRVTGDGDGTTTINVQGSSTNNVLDNNSNGTKIAFQ